MCRSIQKSIYKPKRKKNLIMKFILLRVWDSDFLSFSLEHTKTKLMEISREIWLQRLKIIYLAMTSQKLKRGSEFLEPFPTKFLFQHILGSKTQTVILVLETEKGSYICQVFNKYLISRWEKN